MASDEVQGSAVLREARQTDPWRVSIEAWRPQLAMTPAKK
jgi:hypothetical protein